MISFGKLRHNIEAYDTIFRLLNWNAVCVCNGKLNEGDEQRIFSPDGLGSSN